MNCLRNMCNAPREIAAKVTGLISLGGAVWCGRCIYLLNTASELGSVCRALFWRGLYTNVADMLRFESECPDMNDYYIGAVKAGVVAATAAGVCYLLSQNNQALQKPEKRD